MILPPGRLRVIIMKRVSRTSRGSDNFLKRGHNNKQRGEKIIRIGPQRRTHLVLHTNISVVDAQ